MELFLEIIWIVRDTAQTVLGVLSWKLMNKLYYGVYKGGNGHGFWVHNVEPVLGDWP